MTDLQRAKTLLSEGRHTCVLCKSGDVRISDQRGILPMVTFLQSNTDLTGCSAADKIVGKAAAHLFFLAGVKAVWAEVMSKDALAFLQKKGIDASFNTLTDRIINREGTGPCPMEQAVSGCEESKEALERIIKTLKELREKSMKKLGFGLMRLPKTDPEVPESIDLEQFKEMTDRFLDRGYTYFDTAYMYHNSESERAVKTALTSRIDREKYLLATKLPTMKLETAEDMERIFNEQREKCGVDYFDYYLLHCLNTRLYEIATRLGAFDFVMQKKADGKVKKFGFSFHDTAEVLDKILTEHPEVEFVQLQINYLDWESPTVQSRLCYEVARKHGKDIIIMEPIKGGALAKVPAEAKMLMTAADPSKSPAQWALQFVAGLPGVIMVLSGMSDLHQLDENTVFFNDLKPLTKEETAMLFRCADIINKSVAVSCTGCEYCTADCPKNIPIPQWFDVYNKGEDGKDLAKDHPTPADCIGCGKCEKQCPQKLPIRRLLSAAKQTMKL